MKLGQLKNQVNPMPEDSDSGDEIDVKNRGGGINSFFVSQKD